MPARVMTNELADQITQMRDEGITLREIADMLGVAVSTISRADNNRGREYKPVLKQPRGTPRDYIPEPEPELPRPHGYEMPKRDAPAYDVLVYNIEGMEGVELSRKFVYYPNIWDMCRLCRDAGIQRAGALNFQHYGNCLAKGVREIEGIIISAGGKQIGEYLITKLTNEAVHPQEVCR